MKPFLNPYRRIETMNEQKKRRGCLRTGCLMPVIVPFVLIALVWAIVSWNQRLPESFVLRLPITGQIDERPADQVSFPFAPTRQLLSQQELLAIMDRARTDGRVRSVLLEIDGLSAPTAKIEELRRSIELLRGAGKKVTAFLHAPEDKDYLLAVSCDSVVVQKGSWLQLDGLKAETFFFAEPLGKLGVGFQASQWKKYKSAIEPFTRSSSTPESREEVGQLLDGAWGDYLGYVSARRGISQKAFAAIVDSVALVSPQKALATGLVDRETSAWQLEKMYEKRYGALADELFVGGHEYLQATGGMNVRGKAGSVAVINITGMIVSSGRGLPDMSDGEGTDEATLKHALRTALDDSDVKAIVLRIDSPGGDALAGAAMLEMLDAARGKKPIVASMSGVAASGGYMAAIGADRILAEPMTITGSIGVFALKPDLSGILKKTGLNREVITRGRYADAYSPFRPFDEAAFGKFDENSGDIYRDFVSKVALRRKMTPEQVDAVAGGRVWTGAQALKVGLVDGIGGLAEAVKTAQALARMDTSKPAGIIYLPASRTLADYLFDNDSTLLGPGLASRIAGLYIRESMPFARSMPMPAAARLLMGTDAPQVLAIQPYDIRIQ
jgi:protease IV